MAQSLTNVLIHIVFSTKNRDPLLRDKNINIDLYSYIAGIFREKNILCYKIGGTSDHIHIACSLPKIISISNLVKEIKTSTSTWLKTKTNALADFYWQTGYGVFSISPSHLHTLCEYIKNQEEHHKNTDFKNEFIGILKKYNTIYDEKYLWS